MSLHLYGSHAIEPAPSLHPGDHGIARRAVDFPDAVPNFPECDAALTRPGTFEIPEAAQLVAPTKGDVPDFVPETATNFAPGFDAGFDPGIDTTDAAPDDAEEDAEDDAELGAADEVLAEPDGPMAYFPPRRAVRWLRQHGINIDLHALRHLVAHDAGPAVAFFMLRGGRGRWMVRGDQLSQWAAFRFGLDLSP